jgi:hypothetical protein
MRHRKKHFASAGFAAMLISIGPAQASRLPRIELLRSAIVAGPSVLLSDLLPEEAPESLRSMAAAISLGAAPQAGNSRILDRGTVERISSATPEVLEEVSVPERMLVSRQRRAITVSEVLVAIRAAVSERQVPSEDTLEPEDVRLETDILVAPGDPGLRVVRMNLDRGLGRARFLLWASRDPQVLPFYATVRVGRDSALSPVLFSARLGDNAKVAAGHRLSPATERLPKPEILVAQGELATLTLQSAAVRIFVDVVCLERGTLGQTIRVRLPDSEKIFSAHVDGKSRLEAGF